MNKIKVLMLGWEFPPLINGGLGIACYGIAKAMSKVSDLTLILPKSSPDTYLQNVEILGLNNIDVKGKITYKKEYEEAIKKYESFSKVYTIAMEGKTAIYPYDLMETEAPKIDQLKTESQKVSSSDLTSLTGESHEVDLGRFSLNEMYGEDVEYKVSEYADYVAALASNLEFDIIHVHDWMTMLAGLKVKYQSGKPLVIHAHALSYDRAGPDARGWNYDLEKYGLENADAVIPVSYYTGKVVEKHYGINPTKIFPVHNGIEPVEVFHVKKDFPEKLVLFLGRITEQKGPEIFLDIASKVIAKNDNVRFVMAGNGDQLKRIIETGAYRKVGNKFHFTGFLNRDKVNKLLAMADVYCMPSVSEPFGLSAVEAAQFGIPAVISKQSGAAEVMDHALKADFWDVDLMAKQINDLLLNEEIRKEVVEGTFKDIERVTWDQSAIGILKAYEAVLGRPIPVDGDSVSPQTSAKVNEVMASLSSDIDLKEFTNNPKDELTKIKGIDKDVETILNKAGIFTWVDVVNTKSSVFKQIAKNAAPTAEHVSTWQKQAQLASIGDWEQLEQLQKNLENK